MRNVLIFLTIGLSVLFAQQDSLLREAINHIEDGNGEAAFELFSKCIELNDTLSEPWFGRAQAGMMIHIPQNILASKDAYRNPVTLIQSRMESIDTAAFAGIISDIYKGLELSPEAVDNLWGLPYVYIILDSLERADAVLGEIASNSQELREKLMAHSIQFYVLLEMVDRSGSFGKLTDETQALSFTAAELGNGSGTSGVYYIAVAEMVIGNTETALIKLKDSMDSGKLSVDFVKADPVWNSVRDTDAYKKIIDDAEKGFEDMRGKSLSD